TGTAAPLPGGDMVALGRDHSGDPTPAQLPADDTGGVGTVGDHHVGPSTWPAATQTWNVDVGEDLGEHRTVVALSSGDHDRQRATLAVNSMMDLRGQPAARASDAVTCGFNLLERRFLVVR